MSAKTALPPRLVRDLDHWSEAHAPLPPLLQRLVDREAPWPMMLGTWQALAARYPDVPIGDVKWLLRLIAGSDAYCRACFARDAMRHDLDGTPIEPVSPEHRDAAIARVDGNKRARMKAQAARKQAATLSVTPVVIVEAAPAPVAVVTPLIPETPPATPRRASLSDLRATAQRRRGAQGASA